MTNPPYIKDHIKTICKALNHPNIFSFMHLPVQSGSNKVLDTMKRKYTIQEFEYVLNELIKHVPRIHITTDIICGFPTENEDDFKETLILLNKYKFPSLNISQFYPRPGTYAAKKMKKLDTKIVKRRSRECTKLFKSYIPFTDRIDEIHTVLITEMARDGIHYCGHNKCYDHFIIDYDKESLMGKIVKIKIISVGKFHLKGKVLQISNDKHPLWLTKGLINPNNFDLKQRHIKQKKYFVICLIIAVIIGVAINFV